MHWHLLVVGYPAGGLALGVLALAVVFTGEAVIVYHHWRGVFIEQPLGGQAGAGLALELGALPVAELLCVEVVGVGVDEAVDAGQADGVGLWLMVVCGPSVSLSANQ